MRWKSRAAASANANGIAQLAQVWPRLLEAGLSIAPGSGEVMSARDSAEAGRRMSDAIRAGDYGGAFSHGAESVAAAMGALPFIGLAVRGGRAATRLPMDYASRMRRAGEGGFEVRAGEDPGIWYHGTTADIRPGFDPAFYAQGHPLYSGTQGVWMARSPYTAESFAVGEGANIMPLRVRLGRSAPIDWPAGVHMHEIAATLADLRDRGYDSVIFRRYGGPGTPLGRNALPIPISDAAVIFDPRNIRSVHAAFDPRRRLSRDLLAGVGGAAALPLLNLGLGGGGELGPSGREP